MALDVGTTAADMMLLPYMSDPETGSRIPSMSTGGAAMNAMMNSEVAVSNVGTMITPNQPRYRRLLVDVMKDASFSQGYDSLPRVHNVEVIYGRLGFSAK